MAERVGIEPTSTRKNGRTTVLKTARATRHPSLSERKIILIPHLHVHSFLERFVEGGALSPPGLNSTSGNVSDRRRRSGAPQGVVVVRFEPPKAACEPFSRSRRNRGSRRSRASKRSAFHRR